MRILIAEDEDVSRLELSALLSRSGHEVMAVVDGAEAWQAFQEENPPQLAILDWMMPERDGVDVCRLVRQSPALSGVYLILLTARTGKEHVVEGLKAGADDYVAKPFHRQELLARVNVGARMVHLRSVLAARVRQLEVALSHVKQLQGLLPMCSYCKRIRDDRDYWQQVDAYISEHSEARVSHGICPACYEKLVRQDSFRQGFPLPQTPPARADRPQK